MYDFNKLGKGEPVEWEWQEFRCGRYGDYSRDVYVPVGYGLQERRR